MTEDRTSFLSFFSHETRAHLGLIRNYAEILLSHPPRADEQRRDFLGVIRDESDYLIRLLAELVDMERMEVGEKKWQIAPASISATLRRSLMACQEEASAKEIAVTCLIDDDLPKPALDEHALSRAFIHLILNAIRFSHRGGAITLRAAGSQTPGGAAEVRVTVEDHGIGIRPEAIPRIFQKFFKAANPVDGSPEGSGIGLALARLVIEHFHGRLEVESVEGRGSRFTAILPV